MSRTSSMCPRSLYMRPSNNIMQISHCIEQTTRSTIYYTFASRYHLADNRCLCKQWLLADSVPQDTLMIQGQGLCRNRGTLQDPEDCHRNSQRWRSSSCPHLSRNIRAQCGSRVSGRRGVYQWCERSGGSPRSMRCGLEGGRDCCQRSQLRTSLLMSVNVIRCKEFINIP